METSRSLEQMGTKFYELTVEERRKKYAMSARNSSYWLQVVARSHSDLSLQTAAAGDVPPPPPTLAALDSGSWKTVESVELVDDPSPAAVDDVVFEHQRYQLVLGWGSKGCLLPLDPKKYATEGYAAQCPVFPTVALPVDDDCNGRWEWITPWQIQVTPETDKDGWRYSKSFSHLRLESTACFASHRPTTFCRRRKWVRRRVVVPVTSPAATHPNGALLERKSGWLWKLGHRRKNWKRRYFVLDGSVLQYYSNDVDAVKTKSKLKGEVLLFHKETTVHYADAEATDRAFAFAIDAGAYTLLLQAASELEREAWLYALEDAILCRDSYSAFDDADADDRRDHVARRRSLSKTSVGGLRSLADGTHFVQKFKYHFEKLSRTESIESNVVRALKSYRMYVERTLAKVLERFCEHMKRQGVAQEQVEDRYYAAREAALHSIERATFVPLQGTMHSLLMQSLADGEATLHAFEARRSWLAAKPQAFFEIHDKHISPSDWRACTEQLNALDNYVLPSEQGRALVEAAKSIYAVYRAEHAAAAAGHLAADDFLPIFIYVLCQSRLRHTLLTRRILSETTISSIMLGEIGYYTTMLEAAVEFVSSIRVC
ncbi:hypothetical protein ACHHYP_10540 [Achlya hypogyna]|uniref:VPS9 domain-containing protein n=1 Tax=Achlya hypogyna TaxID=1202772 RepID=A0A1V9YL51_ACHHY|nr:hypothetical protein ACHHYP_10540 [Achlya hypogyna]